MDRKGPNSIILPICPEPTIRGAIILQHCVTLSLANSVVQSDDVTTK